MLYGSSRGSVFYNFGDYFRSLGSTRRLVRIDAKDDGTNPEEYQLCSGRNPGCDTAEPGNRFNAARKSGWDYGGIVNGSDFSVLVHPNYNQDQDPEVRTVRMNAGSVDTTPVVTITPGVEHTFQVKGRRHGFTHISLEPVGGSTSLLALVWNYPTFYPIPVDYDNPTPLPYSDRSQLPTLEYRWADSVVNAVISPNTINITSSNVHDLAGQKQGITFEHQASNPTPVVSRLKFDYRTGSGTGNFAEGRNLYSTTPTALTTVEKVNNNQIKVSFVDDYTDTTNTISQWQYRIGTEPTTPIGTNPFQTTWTTQDWTNICDTDLGTDTGTGGVELTTFTIRGTQPHGTNNCGDNQAGLDGGNYRIHLRGVDNTQTNRQHVRQYVSTNLTTITAPPTTTPTTPTTQPPGTTPHNPTVTPPTATTPTTPTQTQPTTPTTPPPTQPPTAQPPAPSGGSNTAITQATPTGNNIQITGNDNIVIIGDQNTITFTDTQGHTHETNISQLAQMGVTRGCNPPDNTRFCPNRAVTRGEMATFLVRAFELPPADDDPFTDTVGNIHQTNINRMAGAEISRGCNPPTNDEFCPDRAVTRAEMATFMTRVLELEEEGSGFDDTTGNVHATNIRRFAEAGITRGCNPPENSRFCPERAVTRAEMATFLIRSTSLNNS